MEELLFTKIPVVATLTAVFFLLSAAQTLHALFLGARKSGRPGIGGHRVRGTAGGAPGILRPPPCCRHTQTTASSYCTCA